MVCNEPHFAVISQCFTKNNAPDTMCPGETYVEKKVLKVF